MGQDAPHGADRDGSTSVVVVRLNRRELDMLDALVERQRAANPGVRITRSSVLRGLMIRAWQVPP